MRFFQFSFGVLLAAAAVQVPAAQAQVAPQFGAGLHMRETENYNDTDSTDLLLQVDFVLNHTLDTGQPRSEEQTEPAHSDQSVEPHVYILHLNGLASLLHESDDPKSPRFYDFQGTLIGFKAREWDTSYQVDLANTEYANNYAVDEQSSLRITVLNVATSLMPKRWRKEGHHNFYFKGIVDALGYKMVELARNSATYNGLYWGKLGAEAGLTVYFKKIPFHAAVGADADAASRVQGNWALQSDMRAYAKTSAEWKSWGHPFSVYIEGVELHSTDHEANDSATARELTSGLQIFF